MKILTYKTLGAVTLGLFLQNAAMAATIDDLFNTGVDNMHQLLNGGVTDPNYSFSLQPSPSGLTVQTVPDGFPIPPWVANQPDSRWIGPNTSFADGPSGTYKYLTHFTLPSNTLISSIIIAGNWAADNRDPNSPSLSQILLNGQKVFEGLDQGLNPGDPTDGYDKFSFFSFNGIDFSNLFVSGTNTLEFQVVNAVDNPGVPIHPTGLQVEFTTKSYTTPAPTLNSVTALTLMMLGLAGWTFSYQRRKV